MTFEFTAGAGFDFLTGFSQQFGAPVIGNQLQIPGHMGQGSIRRIDFSDSFKLLIHQYTLRDDFVLRRKAPETVSDLITIIFYNSSLPNNQLSNRERSFTCTKVNTASVEVSSNDLNSEIHFPGGREIYFTVVGIKAALLAELLGPTEPNELIDRVTNGSSTFLYHLLMIPEFEKTLKNLAETHENDPLNRFFYKVKTQELLYHVFSSLAKRENKKQCGLNNQDVGMLMTVRDALLADLSEPPQLRDLAKLANMSETKLKQLFRQIFGDSIYNYYQTVRMEEAATMLRHPGVSVSQVGYQLGFSNLSHFSRLFAKHHGKAPKRYQSVG
ncbi:AraC family transcriptional regulator [Dyadobacter beijingensis]|uniref:AraC family transcriptional regulator n=1 Tax=Dyadobacter beijingensis TaxID=365489 RepID=A0ABQ2HBX9_9BACT|nr:AraC family transcriptional regulator [Dyadobacter beijingensis]GGM73057.1 AraC family transcriptional regulator [Dyadobacter beijingensis]